MARAVAVVAQHIRNNQGSVQMIELFDIFNEHIWIVDFALLCVFAALALKLQHYRSNAMTMVLVVLFSGVVINYQLLVNTFASPDTSVAIFSLWCAGFAVFECVTAFVLFKSYQLFKRRNSNLNARVYAVIATTFMIGIFTLQFGPLLFGLDGPSYKLWVLFSFDMGSAGLCTLAIYSIAQVHLLSHISYGFIAKMYLLAFFITALLHIVVFTELFLWETNHLQETFHWALAGINSGTTSVTAFIACLAIFKSLSNKKREGGLWDL
jgi:hypothetical protein